MIHYALRCAADHEFDGWFKDSVSFDAQAASGLLDCPVCGTSDVARALMAPQVHGARRAAEPAAPSPEVPAKEVALPQMMPAHAAPAAMPDQMRAMLQRMRMEVERRCDYVGPRFAEEARRIHAGDEAERPIYGEATPEEAASLADDGIEVSRIPWVPRADS
jgi:hypothetical protein